MIVVIDGLAVPVVRDTSYVVEQDGEFTRSFGGRGRNDVPGRFRIVTVNTSELDTADKDALIAKLQIVGPIPCSGDLFDPPADFHSGPYEVRPITATDWRVNFRLFETDYTP